MCPNTVSLTQPLDKGVMKAFQAHCASELHGTAFQAPDANKDTCMVVCWKSITVRRAIEHVSTAWGSIKQATVNNCWGNVWPDCVKNSEGFEGMPQNIKNSVKSIMRSAQQISGVGFSDMKEGDVEEILAETAEPTNKVLDEIAEHGTGVHEDKDGEDGQSQTPELSLSRQPRKQNGILPWRKFSQT